MSFLLPQPDHPVAKDKSNLILKYFACFLFCFVFFYPKDKCKHFKYVKKVCVKSNIVFN